MSFLTRATNTGNGRQSRTSFASGRHMLDTPNLPQMQKLKELLLKDPEAAHAQIRSDAETPALAERLLDDEMVNSVAAKLLACFYVEKCDGKKIDQLLMHELPAVRAAAAWYLAEISETREIEFALPAIGNALADPSDEIQAQNMRSLLNAAFKESTRERAISILANALSHEDPRLQVKAAETLVGVAEKGTKITSAVHALGNSLAHENPEMRKHAARALLNAAANESTRDDAISVLRNALSHKDDAVRLLAAQTLCEAAEKGDISLAIPALANAVYDKKADVRAAVASALKFAAEKDHIASAIPMLEHSLSDPDGRVRENASRAFVYAIENPKTSGMAVDYLTNALSKKKYARELAATALRNAVRNEKTRESGIAAFAKALHIDDGEVQMIAGEAFMEAAEAGIDIIPALPDISDALTGPNLKLRKMLLCALGHAAYNGMDILPALPAIGKALADGRRKSGDARLAASWVLAIAGEKGSYLRPVMDPLADALGDGDPEVRMNSARAFVSMLANKDTRDAAALLLGKKAAGNDERAAEMAAWSLLCGIEKGFDITAGIPGLGDALGSKYAAVKFNATLALLTSVEKGLDLTPAIAPLGKCLADRDRILALNAAKALLFSALDGVEMKDAEAPLQVAANDRNPEISTCAKNALSPVKSRNRLLASSPALPTAAPAEP